MMKKADMIQTIIDQMDRCWEILENMELQHGISSPEACDARARWSELDELCEKLGIKDVAFKQWEAKYIKEAV